MIPGLNFITEFFGFMHVVTLVPSRVPLSIYPEISEKILFITFEYEEYKVDASQFLCVCDKTSEKEGKLQNPNSILNACGNILIVDPSLIIPREE